VTLIAVLAVLAGGAKGQPPASYAIDSTRSVIAFSVAAYGGIHLRGRFSVVTA